MSQSGWWCVDSSVSSLALSIIKFSRLVRFLEANVDGAEFMEGGSSVFVLSIYLTILYFKGRSACFS